MLIEVVVSCRRKVTINYPVSPGSTVLGLPQFLRAGRYGMQGDTSWLRSVICLYNYPHAWLGNSVFFSWEDSVRCRDKNHLSIPCCSRLPSWPLSLCRIFICSILFDFSWADCLSFDHGRRGDSYGGCRFLRVAAKELALPLPDHLRMEASLLRIPYHADHHPIFHLLSVSMSSSTPIDARPLTFEAAVLACSTPCPASAEAARSMPMLPTRRPWPSTQPLQPLPSSAVLFATCWVSRKLFSLGQLGTIGSPPSTEKQDKHADGLDSSRSYPLYVGSFLSYNHNQNEPFVISAGAILGICAGLLWTAQGAIMMAYASEGEKGRYIGIFWAIFNAGAVIGGLVPLIQNVASTQSSVGDGTYVGFLALTLVGCVASIALCKTERVIRPDGSTIAITQQPTWKGELIGVWKVLVAQPALLSLFPLFFASNWFYTYQFNVSLDRAPSQQG